MTSGRPTALPGTRELEAEGHSAFRDRYRVQYQNTVDHFDRLLAEARQARRLAGRLDSGSLGDRRRLLVERTGYSQFACKTVPTIVAGPVGAGRRRHYRLSADSPLAPCGEVIEPAAMRGAVVLAGHGPAMTRRLAGAYRDVGIRVMLPSLPGPRRSPLPDGRDSPIAFSDDEYVHLMAWAVGGSLVGLEAAEILATTEALKRVQGDDGYPILLDLGGRHQLTGMVAAALCPGAVSAVILREDEAALDARQQEERASALWGFQKDFGAATLMALAENTAFLQLAGAGFPSEADLPVSPAGSAAVMSLPNGIVGSNSGEDYQHAMNARIRFLRELHEAARVQRRAQWSGLAADPARYRLEIKRSLERVLGPTLESATDSLPRTRLRNRTETHDVYEVLLRTVEDIDTCGYLLIPNRENWRLADLRGPWPCVIVQHGRGGRPEALVGLEELPGEWIYDRVAERLAQKGYVVFAPFMNWGWGTTEDRDRLAIRAYALGITPNRPEAAQLEVIVRFLQQRPEVRPDRIAFYGLSYGGHAALWLASTVPSLAAVVVAGHFNQWQNKLFATDAVPPSATPMSFVCADEGCDMFYFNVLNELDHAQLLSAHLPRPAMVETGLQDRAIPTPWVDEEFAEVRAAYELAGAPAAISIEQFDGPHRIWAEKSFQFLREVLHA